MEIHAGCRPRPGEHCTPVQGAPARQLQIVDAESSGESTTKATTAPDPTRETAEGYRTKTTGRDDKVFIRGVNISLGDERGKVDQRWFFVNTIRYLYLRVINSVQFPAELRSRNYEYHCIKTLGSVG